MEIHIAGDNIDLTDALQEYATKKLQKIHTLFSNITHVQVTLGLMNNKQNILHSAKATVHMANTEVLHASAEDKDMYAAIDFLSDKIKKQVKKHKEKMSHHGNHKPS